MLEDSTQSGVGIVGGMCCKKNKTENLQDKGVQCSLVMKFLSIISNLSLHIHNSSINVSDGEGLGMVV